MLGLGLVQALGDEMSRELGWARAQGLLSAATTGQPERVLLETHGVSFGTLLVSPDGGVDASEVQGVDADLVVRPFGWRGTQARLRRVVEEAALLHSGLQSVPALLLDRERPDPARFGDGADWFDRDGDGLFTEHSEGTLTAAAVYLELLEVLVVLPPSDPGLLSRWARGRTLFAEVGCEGCHRETLGLRTTLWVERPDSTGGPGVSVKLLADGDAPRGSGAVHLFSDLKRHAMGEGLASPQDDGSALPAAVFLTRPLWGLADTAPYLHDGRAGASRGDPGARRGGRGLAGFVRPTRRGRAGRRARLPALADAGAPGEVLPMRTSLLLAFAVWAGACTEARVERSPARPDGTLVMRGEAGTRAEARLALEEDARRREARFLEAVSPGRALASTELRDDELAAGLVSWPELFALGGQLFHHDFPGEVSRVGGGGLPDA